MSRFLRAVLVLSMVGLFSVSVTSSVFAESSESGKSLTGFLKRLFNYPVKATKETAGMTANTVQNTGEKILQPAGENTAAVLTGHVEKTGDLIAEPVKGTLETAGQTVAETAEVPVKAAEEEKPAESSTPAASSSSY